MLVVNVIEQSYSGREHDEHVVIDHHVIDGLQQGMNDSGRLWTVHEFVAICDTAKLEQETLEGSIFVRSTEGFSFIFTAGTRHVDGNIVMHTNIYFCYLHSVEFCILIMISFQHKENKCFL